MEKLVLNFNGTTVSIMAPGDFLQLLRHDFSFYVDLTAGLPKVAIQVKFEKPNFSGLPEIYSTSLNERCAVYSAGPSRWQVYYNNEALSEWNTQTDSATFYSLDEKLLHELVYLFILSRTGEHHDLSGKHRIHASAICKDGQAVVFTMPSGGGKTTLAMAGLEVPGWQFMSDDSPYVSLRGDIFSFPTRLGLRQNPINVPEEQISTFRRRQFDDKYLVNTSLFSGRIATAAKPLIFLVGFRKLSGAPQIFPISRFYAFRQAFKTLVIGLGLPQLIEYFLRLDLKDFFMKAGIALSRTVACTSLILRSKTYGIALGPNLSENINCYQKFLAELMPDKSSRQTGKRTATIATPG